MMRRKGSEKRSLPVPLTRPELLEKAEQHAWLLNQKQELANRQEEAKAKMKADQKEIDAKLAASAEILRTGNEERTVDVAIVINDRLGRVFWIRTDMNEVVEARDIRPDERQLHIVTDSADADCVLAVEQYMEAREDEPDSRS